MGSDELRTARRIEILGELVAMTELQQPLLFVDNPNAPDFYADNVMGFFSPDGTVMRITLEREGESFVVARTSFASCDWQACNADCLSRSHGKGQRAYCR